MMLRNLETGMMKCLRPGIICLAIALVACSHDKVAATQPAIVEAIATKPAAMEPTKSTPAAEKPAANENSNNELSTLKPGQSASIDGSTKLHYIRLVSDSRCPVGTQCIWAGEATIELTLESGKEKQIFTLTDRTNTKSVMGFSIELVSIDRGHLVTIRTRKL